MQIQILLLIKVMRICDHWSTDPPALPFEPLRIHCQLSIHGFILSLSSSKILTLMWIRILLFTLMWIRIQLPKITRIRIRNSELKNIYLSEHVLDTVCLLRK
jgi:hypothetical protein